MEPVTLKGVSQTTYKFTTVARREFSLFANSLTAVTQICSAIMCICRFVVEVGTIESRTLAIEGPWTRLVGLTMAQVLDIASQVSLDRQRMCSIAGTAEARMRVCTGTLNYRCQKSYNA